MMDVGFTSYCFLPSEQPSERNSVSSTETNMRLIPGYSSAVETTDFWSVYNWLYHSLELFDSWVNRL